MATFTHRDIGEWTGWGAIIVYRGSLRLRMDAGMTNRATSGYEQHATSYVPGNLRCLNPGHNDANGRSVGVCSAGCVPVIEAPYAHTLAHWPQTRQTGTIDRRATFSLYRWSERKSAMTIGAHSRSLGERQSERESAEQREREMESAAHAHEPVSGAESAVESAYQVCGYCGMPQSMHAAWCHLRPSLEAFERIVSAVAAIAEKHESERAAEIALASDPYTIDRLMPYVTARDRRGHTVPLALAGPTGCGKTTIAEMIAVRLGLPFYTDSFNADMGVSDLLGSREITSAGTVYAPSAFVLAYETGGVYCADEIDASDSNTLLALNRALANGSCPVPNRPENRTALRHPDFYCIAGANTLGSGANRVYVGRNQLDEASRNRFHWIEWGYSLTFERTVIETIESASDRDRVTAFRDTMRAMLARTAMRRVFSTRTIEQWSAYLRNGITLDTLVSDYFVDWSDKDQATARESGIPMVPAALVGSV